MRTKIVKNKTNIEWPGGFELYNQARKLLKTNLWNILTLFVGYFFVYLITSQLMNRFTVVNKVVKLTKNQNVTVAEIRNYPIFILLTLFLFLVLNLFNLMIYFYGFKNTESKSAEISDVFRSVKKYYLRFLGVSFIGTIFFFINIILLSTVLTLLTSISSTGISILIGLIVLFAEVYLLVPRFILVYSLILQENLGIIDSFKQSWKMTKPHLTKLQMYLLAGITWGVLAFILAVTVIGIPVAIYILMFVLTSPALLYNYIKSQN